MPFDVRHSKNRPPTAARRYGVHVFNLGKSLSFKRRLVRVSPSRNANLHRRAGSNSGPKYDVAHLSFLIEFAPVGTSLTRFGIARMSPRRRFGIVCITRRLPHVRSNSARRLPHAT